MKQCYECDPKMKGGSNHVKCVVRMGRKSRKTGKPGKCSCWCLDKSSKYSNVFPSKKVRRIRNG